ncbi:tetratricopeptide repeat protein [Variovorax sp. dw_308]|uniref:tetratricopeptide repeat protein n=1 Tax=Variovorax sp. dw_308 TaxID=2721546 RepID=UPI001C45C2A9|nr:tetratricopeptide repeat protein [Variovorax sp. dw_308]
MDEGTLHGLWIDALAEVGVPATPHTDELFSALVARYREAHRGYHTLQHLAECLSLLGLHQAEAERSGEVALALWFHDAIYDVRSHDNEQKSAHWARDALASAGLSQDAALRVHALVMATRHSAVPEGKDARLLVDIDLAILGAPAARFAEYERQIRVEYAHVPPVLFEPRRHAILSGFLAREPLYLTQAIRAEREAQARINLQAAIDATARTTVPSVEELLALAIQQVNAGERAQAKALCEIALAAHPPHPAAHQLSAWLLLQQGDAVAARDQIEHSLALRPQHEQTLVLAGEIARASAQPAVALRYFERAHGLQPERPERRQLVATVWFELALQHHDAGDLQGAARALREALRLMPRYVEAEVNLGIVLQETGDMDGALQAYGRAYRLRDDTFGRIAHALSTPRSGRLWLNLDELRATLGATPR